MRNSFIAMASAMMAEEEVARRLIKTYLEPMKQAVDQAAAEDMAASTLQADKGEVLWLTYASIFEGTMTERNQFLHLFEPQAKALVDDARKAGYKNYTAEAAMDNRGVFIKTNDGKSIPIKPSELSEVPSKFQAWMTAFQEYEVAKENRKASNEKWEALKREYDNVFNEMLEKALEVAIQMRTQAFQNKVVPVLDGMVREMNQKKAIEVAKLQPTTV